MGHRQRAAELLAKADRYRVHARSLSDRETAGRIWDLADEMERQAQHLIKMLKEEVSGPERTKSGSSTMKPAKSRAWSYGSLMRGSASSP
jgi:hypothetical protein